MIINIILIKSTIEPKNSVVLFIYTKTGKKEKRMTKTMYQPNYWHYLTGDFLYRVHPRFRKTIKILIAVVLVALLLAGLYALFNDTVLPTLVERVKEMFDYAG